jgi:hypothetical protein
MRMNAHGEGLISTLSFTALVRAHPFLRASPREAFVADFGFRVSDLFTDFGFTLMTFNDHGNCLSIRNQ